jgi:hypothetical protein
VLEMPSENPFQYQTIYEIVEQVAWTSKDFLNRLMLAKICNQPANPILYLYIQNKRCCFYVRQKDAASVKPPRNSGT